MKLLGSLFLLVLCLGGVPRKVVAQATAPAPAASPAAAGATKTETTVYKLPPDKLAKAKALYDLRVKLRIVDTAYSLIVLLALLSLGIAAKYRDWAEKAAAPRVQIFAVGLVEVTLVLAGAESVSLFFRQESLSGKIVHVLALVLLAWICIRIATRRAWAERFAQALIFVPLLLLTITVVGLPLDAYQQSISRQYGLSVQGWGSWFGDILKGQAVSLVILTVAIWGITFLIRKSPRRWWFYLWLISIPVSVFFVVITPVVIDPLFNKFEPLDKNNPQLVEAIQKVTQRGGLEIPRDRMFLMKASEKVTTLNAYVTGFGPSKRVVVWDTTVKNASTPETLFIFGHEMGHYVLDHIVIGLAATEVGLLAGLYLLYLISNRAFARFQQRWHMRELSDWAAVPMLFLVFSVLSLLSQPINSAFSRQLEHNADVYGLEVTHGINANSQEAGAHAFQVLGELSLSYPYPGDFVVFWYADHPPIRDRVPFAHNYDPWSKGEQPKYVK
jgi:Zn-dependent protease with chaperone function